MAGSRKDHDGFRLCIQNTAVFQGGRVTRQVLFDTGEDWNQVGVQAIDLVLALPFPEDESAVQQAAEIMGDTTLLEPKLLTDLADMMARVNELVSRIVARAKCLNFMGFFSLSGRQDGNGAPIRGLS